MGLQQDFQTREKIFSVRLNGLKKPTLRSHECPRRGTADGRSPGGEGSEQHSSSAPGRSEAGPQGPASPSSAAQEQPRLLVCSLWLRHVKGWRDCTDKAPARPRTGRVPSMAPLYSRGQRRDSGTGGGAPGRVWRLVTLLFFRSPPSRTRATNGPRYGPEGAAVLPGP